MNTQPFSNHSEVVHPLGGIGDDFLSFATNLVQDHAKIILASGGELPEFPHPIQPHKQEGKEGAK